MRLAWTTTILLALPVLAAGQDPLLAVQPRYGINLNTRVYVQATPQDALAAVITALERNRFDVLVAHLISEKVTDAKAAENARLLEGDAEADLQRLRDRQRANPLGVRADDKLPNEPVAFAAAVKAKAQARGFRATIEDVRKKFAGDTNTVKELKRFLRDGDVAVTGETAAITLKDVKGKGIYFTKSNGRWYAEDWQDPPAKDPKP